jgi:sensor domain CHASE-containing protein
LGLHKKTLIVACLGALVLIGVVFASTSFVLEHSFATIEAGEARQSIERVNQALQMELHQLGAAAQDNGHGDQAFDYARGRRENFISENFTRDGLDTLRLHLIWIGDDAGKTLVALGTRDAPPGMLAQLNPDLVSRIQKYAPAMVPRDSINAPVQLMRVPHGVLAFSAARILRSSHEGPSSGVLVFGHYIDDAMVRRMAETSQSPVKLILVDEHGVPMADVKRSVAHWLATAQPDNNIFIQTNGSETLDSYMLLRDVEGRPLAVLANGVSHAALQLGRRTITWVVVALLVGFSLLVCLLLTMVNRGWRTNHSTNSGSSPVSRGAMSSLDYRIECICRNCCRG